MKNWSFSSKIKIKYIFSSYLNGQRWFFNIKTWKYGTYQTVNNLRNFKETIKNIIRSFFFSGEFDPEKTSYSSSWNDFHIFFRIRIDSNESQITFMPCILHILCEKFFFFLILKNKAGHIHLLPPAFFSSTV